MSKNRNEQAGFQSLGDQMPEILRMQRERGSVMDRSTNLPRVSETTGLPLQEPRQPNAIGTPRGELGSAMTLDSTDHRKLAAMSPAEVDNRAAASLPQGVRSGLHEKWLDRTIKGEFVSRFQGFSFDGATAAEVGTALDILRGTNAPCPADIAEKAIMALRIRTKAKAEQGDDLKAVVAIYSESAAEYPADVVVTACKEWAADNTFFPAWAELRALLEKHVERRRAMIRVLSLPESILAETPKKSMHEQLNDDEHRRQQRRRIQDMKDYYERQAIERYGSPEEKAPLSRHEGRDEYEGL